jgi:hypothetical protein
VLCCVLSFPFLSFPFLSAWGSFLSLTFHYELNLIINYLQPILPSLRHSNICSSSNKLILLDCMSCPSSSSAAAPAAPPLASLYNYLGQELSSAANNFSSFKRTLTAEAKQLFGLENEEREEETNSSSLVAWAAELSQGLEMLGESLYQTTQALLPELNMSGAEQNEDRGRSEMHGNEFQCLDSTYCTDPQHQHWPNYFHNFDLNYHNNHNTLLRLLANNPMIRKKYIELVPELVPAKLFLARYLFKLHELQPDDLTLAAKDENKGLQYNTQAIESDSTFPSVDTVGNANVVPLRGSSVPIDHLEAQHSFICNNHLSENDDIVTQESDTVVKLSPCYSSVLTHSLASPQATNSNNNHTNTTPLNSNNRSSNDISASKRNHNNTAIEEGWIDLSQSNHNYF